MFARKQDLDFLKATASRKGYLTPKEIMSIYPEPEKNIGEIEQLLGSEIEISETKLKKMNLKLI